MQNVLWRILLSLLVLWWIPVGVSETPASGEPSGMAPAQAGPAGAPPLLAPVVGRYQLIVVPGHSASPFLLDTVTGCVWQQGQSQETKRTVFLEADVENLHWSWGGGTQQILSSRVENSSFTDDQKRLWKESLQKTSCGSTNVVLTPGQLSGPVAPKASPPVPAPAP